MKISISSKPPINGRYIDKNKNNRISARKLVILLFWIAIWQLAYVLAGRTFILPAPMETAAAAVKMVQTEGFYLDILATMGRVIKGILISLAAGSVSAMAAYFSSFFRDMLKPVVTVLKTTPVMAVIIFAILWLKSNNVPVFACFMMSYPVVYTNVLAGLDSTEPQYLEMADLYQIGLWNRIRYIYLPFIRPHIRSAVLLTTGLSWKTIVAAEVLANPPRSMGYNLMRSKMYLETDQLFAWMIMIIILSIIFEKAVSMAIGKILSFGFGGPQK